MMITTNQVEGEATQRLVAVDGAELEFQRIKTAIHEELVESLDLSMIGQIDEEQLRSEIIRLAEELCRFRRKTLKDIDQQRMI
ncbi:MAG: hypothetical protein VB853_03390, partial [Pirellulales bacterium]